MAALKLFYWQGINGMQQKQKGSLIASSKQEAEYQLLQQGLRQIRLQRNLQFSTKPKNAEICELLNRLAVLLAAAIPLKSCLHILQTDCTHIALYEWLTRLLQRLESGQAFSDSLQTDSYLTHQEIQLINVGEMTGKLTDVCRKIAEHRSQSLQLQRKLQKIMLYPAVVLGISVTLSLLLLIFIVPQFADMYASNAAQLPPFTAILLQCSQFLQQNWHIFILSIIAAVAGFRYLLRRSVRCYHLKSRLISHLPLFGDIHATARLVGFCRGLYLMLQAGVPLNQALNAFLPHTESWQSGTVPQGDPILEQEVRTAQHWVTQGYAFSQSVGGGLFPSEALQMLQIGEKSGKLGMMLQQIADNYQEKLNHKIDLLSQLLEPFLMLIIGGLIGMIMLGMYLPIFNMGSVIQ